MDTSRAVLGPGPTPFRCPVDRMRIAWMAVALEDPNLIHVEEEVARRAGYPSVIAHGTFPIGAIGALLTRWAGPGSVRLLDVRLTSPTFPGDQIEASARVTGHGPDGVQLEVEARAGERMLARGIALVALDHQLR